MHLSYLRMRDEFHSISLLESSPTVHACMCVMPLTAEISSLQVSVEAALEHPFFVFDRGWSSCSPAKTDQRFGLACHQLNVSDRCISLTQKRIEQTTPRSSTPLPHARTAADDSPTDERRVTSPSKHDSDGGDIDVTAVSGDTPTHDLGSGDAPGPSQTRAGSTDAEETLGRSDEATGASALVSVDSPASDAAQRTDTGST